MKYRLFILLFLFSFVSLSQNEVYFFKDTDNSLNLESVKEKDFQLLEKTILDSHSDATFWFKIPSAKTDFNYIFRIQNNRVINARAYQNNNEIKQILNERYVTFNIARKDPVYIRVNSNYISHFPINFKIENISNYEEKLQIFINSFYYGFSFLLILYCFTYFYFFRDDAFLYYAFFLLTLTSSFFIIDGMLMFFGVRQEITDFLIILTYIFLAYFSSKFINSFLFLDKHYPKLKKYTYLCCFLIIINTVIYFVTKNYLYYIVLNILVFSLLLVYWLAALFMFKKSVYIKIFVFAYAILLFSGIDFLVLKNLGFSMLEPNAINMKIGGLVQIIFISFAVLFREKVLRDSNNFMKNEILKYSKEIKQLTLENNEEHKKEDIGDLSIREREVFNLIVSGKSNKQIADEVNISVNTVKFHVKNIYGKLNIKNRKEVLTIDNTIKS